MWDIPLYPSYVNGLSTSTKHNPVICGIYPSYIIWLVVLTILKNMKVNRKDDNPYTKWKITVMFETTNQYIYIYYHDYIPIEIPNLLDGYPNQQCHMWHISHNLGPIGSQQIHGGTQRRSSCLERIHGVGGQPWAGRGLLLWVKPLRT